MIILNTNEDGTLLGADTEGNLFTGTPRQISDSELTVTNDVSTDGKSFIRTTSYGDEEIAVSSLTKVGFLDNAAVQSKIDSRVEGGETRKTVEDELWDEEKSISSHAGTTPNRTVIDWEAN